MSNSLNQLYLEMLKYPNGAKPYRELSEHYLKMGRTAEATAYLLLISQRFGEMDDHNSDSDKK
jgi:hypothetical protein